MLLFDYFPYGLYDKMQEVPANDFLPPFENIYKILEEFNFENSNKELFNYADEPSKKNIVDITLAFNSQYLENPDYESAEVLIDQNVVSVKLKEYSNLIIISTFSVAQSMIEYEIDFSFKTFKEKLKELSAYNRAEQYLLIVFDQLDKILSIFYKDMVNLEPFEKPLFNFLNEFYILTYPYYHDDLNLPLLGKVFNKIKEEKNSTAVIASSTIEKIVDRLISDETLKSTSKKYLLEYLTEGIDKDAVEDSVHWLDTATSFTQFISALVKTCNYPNTGSIKWIYWTKALKFPQKKTCKPDTLKKLYYKANKNPDNIFESIILNEL